MTTPLRTLQVARALLFAPERWLRRSAALDAQGTPCDPESLYAACFCLTGAIRHAAASQGRGSDLRWQLRERAERALLPAMHEHHRKTRRPRPKRTAIAVDQLVAFNDSPFTTYQDVIAVLDDAIARMQTNETDDA